MAHVYMQHSAKQAGKAQTDEAAEERVRDMLTNSDVVGSLLAVVKRGKRKPAKVMPPTPKPKPLPPPPAAVVSERDMLSRLAIKPGRHWSTWLLQGNCQKVGINPRIVVVGANAAGGSPQVQRGEAVCRGCEVRGPCLVEALEKDKTQASSRERLAAGLTFKRRSALSDEEKYAVRANVRIDNVDYDDD